MAARAARGGREYPGHPLAGRDTAIHHVCGLISVASMAAGATTGPRCTAPSSLRRASALRQKNIFRGASIHLVPGIMAASPSSPLKIYSPLRVAERQPRRQAL